MILVKIEKHGEKPLDLEIPVNITVRNALRKVIIYTSLNK